MGLNDPSDCTTSWSMTDSNIPSGSWRINITLLDPDSNDMTTLNPFAFSGIGGYWLQVMKINWCLEMGVMHPQLLNQSLHEALGLGAIQYFLIEVVRFEVVSADAFPIVLAAMGESPCCILKQFPVICPLRWQRMYLSWFFSFLWFLLIVLFLVGSLPPLPPFPHIFAKNRASGASPFSPIIAASFWTSLVTISLGVVVIMAFLSIMRSKKNFRTVFLGLPWRR